MTGKRTKWVAARALSLIGVVVIVGLIILTWYRLVFGGEWLLPLLGIYLVFATGAIFSVLVDIYDDMQHVKRASLSFVQQAREETEYLSAMSEYKQIMKEQNPDLN